eukprot:c17001_g1_i1 orf=353-916(-)
MFHEIAIKRLVVVHPSHLHPGILLKASILTQLLEDLNLLKCTEIHGYYVAATTLESVGEGKIRPRTGSVVFPVEFNCIVFMPHKGEVLLGEVKQVLKQGCLLCCGPLEDVFLHVQTMKGFQYKVTDDLHEFARFTHSDGSEIKKGSTVRFRILGLKWVEEKRQFQALATINGHYLGPISDQPNQNLF